MSQILNPIHRRRSVAILAVGAALYLAAPASSTAAPLTGACTLTKTKYIVVTTLATTTSATFVLVPGKIAITQSKAGCVIVQFSAEAAEAGANSVLSVQALLDGNTVGSPANGTFSFNDSYPVSRSMTYVFPHVLAGNHIVQMEYASFQGPQVFLGNRTMVVQYQ